MMCPQCVIEVLPKQAQQLGGVCAWCRIPFITTVSDIFDHKAFDILKETRKSQTQMAKDIDAIFKNTGVPCSLLAEGGTGIGKSYAYLVPALLRSGHRVVVSTAVTALQDQLHNKDAPTLVSKMGLKTPYVLYKGRGNYACFRLMKKVPFQVKKEFEDFADLHITAKQPADKAKWTMGPADPWWSKISTENCPVDTGYTTCPYASYCHPYPKNYELLLVNHTLLALDTLSTPGRLFGPYDILIVDEAHKLPDAFRSVRTHKLKRDQIKVLQQTVANSSVLPNIFDVLGYSSFDELLSFLTRLNDPFQHFFDEAEKAKDEYGIIQVVGCLDALVPVKDALKTFTNYMGKIQSGLKAASLASGGQITESGEVLAGIVELQRLTQKVMGLNTLIQHFESQYTDAQNPSKVPYITTIKDGEISVQPLEIGPLVSLSLRHIPYKIFVSATLSIGGDFTYSKKQFGLDLPTGVNQNLPTSYIYPTVIEKQYESPFDKNRAVMYLPYHIPKPEYADSKERARWITAISEEILRLVKASKGDAFVLFTARGDMNAVVNETRTTWDDTNTNLIVQTEKATPAIAEYLKTSNSVLFGVASIWEGVDIPGDKLRLIIIPKLPFPYALDPVLKARELEVKRQGKDAFEELCVPPMIFDMKQGTGRLIRTQTDKGVIAILDPRVWTGTGKAHETVLKSILEEYARQKELAKKDPNIKPRMVPRGYGQKLLTSLGYLQRTTQFDAISKILLTP